MNIINSGSEYINILKIGANSKKNCASSKLTKKWLGAASNGRQKWLGAASTKALGAARAASTKQALGAASNPKQGAASKQDRAQRAQREKHNWAQ